VTYGEATVTTPCLAVEFHTNGHGRTVTGLGAPSREAPSGSACWGVWPFVGLGVSWCPARHSEREVR